MIEAMVDDIYLLESYLYRKVKPHREKIHAIASVTTTISPDKLSAGERYTLDRLVSFADSVCKRYHLKKPDVQVVNNSDPQMTTNGASGLDRRAIDLMIYRGNLNAISYSSARVAIGHEIGHAFAPMIIRKHRLCSEPWFIKILSIRVACLLTLIIIFGFISSFFIGVTGSLVSIIASITVISATITNHYKKNSPSAIRYRRACEIVSDEFSLRLLKNIHQAVESFREINLDININKLQLQSLNALSYDPHTAKGYSQDEYSKIEANKVFSHFWYELWHTPDNEHPSDYSRVQHLIKFYKSGYRNW